MENTKDSGVVPEHRRAHPDLQGVSEYAPHNLSSPQIEALTAICETLLPSLPPPSSPPPPSNFNDGSASPSSKGLESAETTSSSKAADLKDFYSLSASALGVPLQVAGLMKLRLKAAEMAMVSRVLWLLSTRLGTLLLVGLAAFKPSFPFLRTFAELGQERREAVLIRWSRSPLLPLRTLFKVLKSFTVYEFFSRVDEKGHNPAWRAMGYCGPDPETTRQVSAADEPEAKPLAHAVVDLAAAAAAAKADSDSVREALQAAGCLVSEAPTTPETPAGGLLVTCDAVVVGSGAGGGVIAAQLARAGLRVLVIDKGRYYARGDLSLLEGPSMAAMYESGGFMTSEGGGVGILAGSTVGGGTHINWAASFPTPPHVVSEWANVCKLQRFAGKEYKRDLAVVCERLGVHDDKTVHNFANSVLAQGCEVLGHDVRVLPRNAAGAHSCGWCGLGCRKGAKQAVSETWLVDAAAAGARVVSGCTALRVLHKPNQKPGKPRRACGVLTTVGEGDSVRLVTFRAPLVVSACGSVQTPALLLRSGLTNPAIGGNLRLHPVVGVWGYFPEGQGPPGTTYEGAIMTACSTAVGNWDSSGYGCLLQTPCVHPALFAVALPWNGARAYRHMASRFARIAYFIILTRDKGHGRVRLDAAGQPAIEYFLSPFDADNMKDGVEHGLKVMRAAGAAEVGSLCPGLEAFKCGTQGGGRPTSGSNDDDAFDAYLKNVRATGIVTNRVPVFSAHQTASCPMGNDEAASAVDPHCESWEVEGLYLGDGSVLPTPPGVNPMISIQAVAYGTGQALVRRLALQSS